jgi:pilus assembly protein CpaF
LEPIDIISGEVRNRIRERGIDPRLDSGLTRELIAETIADYDERTLSGSLPIVADKDELGRLIADDVVGFGPLQKYLDDPEVEEIWLNGPHAVYVSRSGVSELTTTVFTEAQVDDLIERMLRTTGRRVDLSSPFVDASLPDGSRLHVVLPDITRRYPAVNIRKFVTRPHGLDALVAAGSLTPAAAHFLHAAVTCGANIMISGATQAGKTTMLAALTGSIPSRERVITCEEVFELSVRARDWVALQCRQPSLEGTGEVTLRTLVKEALRMRPSRIIVGEVREAEAFDMLIGMNSGLPAMSSIHANSARSAVTKLCTLPLLASSNVDAGFVVPTVAGCVDIIVHLRMNAQGHRTVEEIAAVPGGVEGDVVELETLFTRDRAGRLLRGSGFSHLGDRFAGSGFNLHDILEQAA